MNERLLTGAIISGAYAVGFGLVATVLVSLIFSTTNLTWALIAVGFATFFAGFAGYIVGQRHEQHEERSPA